MGKNIFSIFFFENSLKNFPRNFSGRLLGFFDDDSIVNEPEVNLVNEPEVNLVNEPEVNLVNEPEVNLVIEPEVNLVNLPFRAVHTLLAHNTNIYKICKLRKATCIFSVFYNISSPNSAILLILRCSF